MSPLNTALLAGVVAAALSSGWHYHHHQSRAAEAAHLSLENERLRQRISPPSPASIATSSPATPLENGPAPSATTASPRAVGRASLPCIEHLDTGQATPIDALQTFVWACEQGEAARVETIVEFDSAARAKATAYYESIPAHVRKQWRTLEAMAATLLISEGLHYPYPVASVIRCAEVQPLEPDRVALLLPGTRRSRLEFRHTSDGWKYIITEAMVDEYLADRAGSKRRQP